MDKLQILVLEDVEDDAKLITRALRDGGLAFSAERGETREDFLQALEEQRPDVILADYKLPHFDGRSALQLASERRPRAPVRGVEGAARGARAVAGTLLAGTQGRRAGGRVGARGRRRLHPEGPPVAPCRR